MSAHQTADELRARWDAIDTAQPGDLTDDQILVGHGLLALDAVDVWRISLWHREGVSWAQVGEWAGQRDIATTLNRYTHVVPGREIDRGGWLEPIGRFPSRVERGSG